MAHLMDGQDKEEREGVWCSQEDEPRPVKKLPGVLPDSVLGELGQKQGAGKETQQQGCYGEQVMERPGFFAIRRCYRHGAVRALLQKPAGGLEFHGLARRDLDRFPRLQVQDLQRCSRGETIEIDLSFLEDRCRVVVVLGVLIAGYKNQFFRHLWPWGPLKKHT